MPDQSLSPQSQATNTASNPIGGKTPHILTCLFVFALVASGTALTSREPNQNDDSRPLSEVVSVSGTDFGEVVSQPDFSWDIRLSNNSAQTVHVEFIGTSCSCTSIKPGTVTIPPSGERVVLLTMDHGPPRPEDLDGRVFAVRLRALLTLKDDSGPLEEEVGFDVHGRIRNLLAMSPSYLDFGEVVRGASNGGGQKRVVVRSRVRLDELRVNCHSGNFVCSCEPKVGGGGKLFVVTVRPHDRFCGKVQRIRDKIRLIPVAGSMRQFAEQLLMIRCNVVDDVGVRPTSVHFGAKMVGGAGNTTISLYSRTGTPFVVEKVVSASDGPVVTEFKPTQSRPASTHLFRVAQSIEKAGIQRSRVSFFVRSRGARRRDVEAVTVFVTYLGLRSDRDSSPQGTTK